MSKITKFPTRKQSGETRSYDGFEYIKSVKDKNGIRYNDEHLLEYADKNRYVITVMRIVDDEVRLYDFFVKNNDVERFFKSCFSGKIEGEIIEIEKCSPEILA